MVLEDVKFCMFANNLSSSSTSTSTKDASHSHPVFQMNPALAQCYNPHQSLQEYAALHHSASTAGADYVHYLPPVAPSVSASSASASSSTSPVSPAWPSLRGSGYPSSSAAAAQMMRSPSSAAASEMQATGSERGGWSSFYPFYQTPELQGGRSMNPADVNMQSCYSHQAAQHFASASDYGHVDQMCDVNYARAQLMLQRQYQQQQQHHQQQQQDAKMLSPASASSFKNDVMGHLAMATPAGSRAQQQEEGGVLAAVQGSGQASRQQKPPFAWMAKQPSANVAAGIATGKTRTSDKYRVVYTDFQKVELEKEYLYSKYITIQRKAELARFVNLSERQVKIWFQNRRAKERKIKKRDDQGSPLGHSHDADSSASDHVTDYIKLESAGDNGKKFIGSAHHMMDSVILNSAHRPDALQPYIHRH